MWSCIGSTIGQCSNREDVPAWMLWLFGNSRLGYPRLKRISTTDLSTRTKRQTYSELPILMQLIEAGIMDKTGSVLPKKLTEEHALELFRIGVEILPKPPSQHKRRWSQLKVSTVVRLIREHDQAGNPNRRRLQFKKRKRRRSTSTQNSKKNSQSTLSHI